MIVVVTPALAWMPMLPLAAAVAVPASRLPPLLTVALLFESTVMTAPLAPVSVPVPAMVTLPAVDVLYVPVCPVLTVVSASAGVAAMSPAERPKPPALRATGAAEARNFEILR